MSESILSSPVKRPKRHISNKDKKEQLTFGKVAKLKIQHWIHIQNDSVLFILFNSSKIFEKRIEIYGSREKKINNILNYTFNEFITAIINYLTRHDNDLKR